MCLHMCVPLHTSLGTVCKSHQNDLHLVDSSSTLFNQSAPSKFKRIFDFVILFKTCFPQLLLCINKVGTIVKPGCSNTPTLTYEFMILFKTSTFTYDFVILFKAYFPQLLLCINKVGTIVRAGCSNAPTHALKHLKACVMSFRAGKNRCGLMLCTYYALKVESRGTK